MKSSVILSLLGVTALVALAYGTNDIESVISLLVYYADVIIY